CSQVPQFVVEDVHLIDSDASQSEVLHREDVRKSFRESILAGVNYSFALAANVVVASEVDTLDALVASEDRFESLQRQLEFLVRVLDSLIKEISQEDDEVGSAVPQGVEETTGEVPIRIEPRNWSHEAWLVTVTDQLRVSDDQYPESLQSVLFRECLPERGVNEGVYHLIPEEEEDGEVDHEALLRENTQGTRLAHGSAPPPLICLSA
ncbi:hypothetical protein PMAYCL1PPCAC_20735, partial [Pristionchus mayeri]